SRSNPARFFLRCTEWKRRDGSRHPGGGPKKIAGPRITAWPKPGNASSKPKPRTGSASRWRSRKRVKRPQRKNMPLMTRLSSLWRNLFHKARTEQELTEEIDAYLEMLVERNINAGLDPAHARRAALIELGGREQVKEKVREARMGYQLETLWQDLRYALR